MKSMAYVRGPVVPIYVSLNSRVIVSSALWLMSMLIRVYLEDGLTVAAQ